MRSAQLSTLAAAIYDPLLAVAERRGMAARRRELLAGLHGRVLEIGAGTGLNLAAYPAGLDRLVLTEPDAGMRHFLERRVRRSGRSAEVVDAPAEALPFADGSFDAVVSTMVLCSVADPQQALHELRRVLRPGGALRFIEHVRSDTPATARWQDRLMAPWRAFGSGCRCNQRTLELLEREFGSTQVEHDSWSGMPAIVRPLIVGRAAA
jgi:ubiquinone/menaquinone biosynthesis C-methylase UbiE